MKAELAFDLQLCHHRFFYWLQDFEDSIGMQGVRRVNCDFVGVMQMVVEVK